MNHLVGTELIPGLQIVGVGTIGHLNDPSNGFAFESIADFLQAFDNQYALEVGDGDIVAAATAVDDDDGDEIFIQSQLQESNQHFSNNDDNDEISDHEMIEVDDDNNQQL